jgi:hypothetical protein
MRRAATAVLLAIVVVSCGGGGGGSGPTAPPAIPSVAGSWTGTWSVPGIAFPLTPQFIIAQSGQSTTGTITVLGVTLQTTGTVGTDSTFQWQAVASGCGSFTGTDSFAGLAPLTMNGMATLNTLGCPSSGFESGPVTWSKTGNAEKAARGRAGNLEDLLRALRAKAHG